MNYGQPFCMTVAAVSLHLVPMRGAACCGCSELLGSQPKVLRLGGGVFKPENDQYSYFSYTMG